MRKETPPGAAGEFSRRRRILVLGCSGAGKSLLARRLGERLGLPVVHLDALFWRPGWVETPRPEWRERVLELCAEPAWVLDGNYGGTLAQRLEFADAAVYLDYPLRTCLWNVFRRVRRHHGQTRPDMGPGCPEKIDWEFLNWICRFRRKHRPPALKLLNENRAGRSIFIFRNRRETEAFLKSLSSKDVARRNGSECGL